MKIGVVQLDILWENKSQNMKKCEEFFNEASALDCDLLVFPELTLIGFTMDTALAESFSDSESIACFAKYCHQYSIDCVFGLSEKADGKFYNTLVHINKCGELTSKYRKMHPFSFGEEVYEAGDTCCSFTLMGENIGLSICYDLRFPELFQQLSKDCKCIIVSANWPAKRSEHWRSLLQARAIENQCYMIGCNCVGTQKSISYSGNSIVVSPDGDIIASAESSREQFICSTIDLSEAEDLRKSFPVKYDRRTDIYRNFYE